MSASENLSYAARFYGMPPSVTRTEIPAILEKVGFPSERRGEPMENLSRGMQQKVALARALLTAPVLLLLDEPTTGLDPRSKLEVQEFIKDVRATHDGDDPALHARHAESLHLSPDALSLAATPKEAREMTTKTTKPLVPYIRQSKDKTGSASVDDQRRDIARWAKQHPDVKLADEIVEVGVSGSKSWRERGLGLAVAACERGEAQGIIVAWQDRLSRESGLRTAEVWDALERASARLVCANEGLDTATGDQELQFTLKAAIARDQWKRYAANWERAVRDTIESGRHFSSKVPVGYVRGDDKRLMPDPIAAPIVREVFLRRAAGESWAALARFLDERLPRAGRWPRTTIARLIESRTYLGDAHSGEYVKHGAHPAIVTRAEFERAQPKSGESRTPRSGSLLVGLLYCGNCGHPLGHISARNYGCRQRDCSRHVTVQVNRADEFVQRVFLNWFRLVDVEASDDGLHVTWRPLPEFEVTTATLDEADDLEAALKLAEDERDAFLDRAQAGIPDEVWAAAASRRQAAVDDALQAVRSVQPESTSISEVRRAAEIWESRTTAQKRRALPVLIERIEVASGNGPLSLRLRIVWQPDVIEAIAG